MICLSLLLVSSAQILLLHILKFPEDTLMFPLSSFLFCSNVFFSLHFIIFIFLFSHFSGIQYDLLYVELN